MLAIKLRPTGKKHQRYFRIVVAEKKSKLQGRFTDDLGWVNPHTDTFEVRKERITEWLKNGATPTPSAHNVLVRAGLIKEKKIPVHKKPEAAAPQAENA